VPAAFVIEFWWAFIALAVVLAIVFGVVQARNIKALWEGGMTSQGIAWALFFALASAMSAIVGFAGLAGGIARATGAP
jgi:hypothetical protein